MRLGEHGKRRLQAGFSYLVMLFALALFGIGLAALGESWSAASHRAKEEELIQVGNAYVQAIGQYYLRSPGASKSYPRRLADLVDDQRFVGAARYLRRLYRDPVTNDPHWGLIQAADGGIAGVYSLSDKVTLRRRVLTLPHALAITGSSYNDWKFVYQPPPPVAMPSAHSAEPRR